MSKIRMFVRATTEQDGTMVCNFEQKGYIFLVKNFTAGDIYVGLEGCEKEESILIPSETAQTIAIGPTQKIQVITDAASEKGVEIQCIRY